MKSDLFPETIQARKRPRMLMHMIDAGDTGTSAGTWSQFKCRNCCHIEQYEGMTAAAIKRGVPCPICNQNVKGDDHPSVTYSARNMTDYGHALDASEVLI